MNDFITPEVFKAVREFITLGADLVSNTAKHVYTAFYKLIVVSATADLVVAIAYITGFTVILLVVLKLIGKNEKLLDMPDIIEPTKAELKKYNFPRQEGAVNWRELERVERHNRDAYETNFSKRASRATISILFIILASMQVGHIKTSTVKLLTPEAQILLILNQYADVIKQK